MSRVIETKRLYLRKFEMSDAINLFDLNSDPEVIKWTGDEAFASIEAAKHFLKTYSDYERNGFGRWAVINKSNEAFLGWCGLRRNEIDEVDLGFRFFRKHWNKGIATEAAAACLNFGFHHLKLDEVLGRASKQNTASIRVLEKLGMTYLKDDDLVGIDDAVYYKIDKSTYIKKE